MELYVGIICACLPSFKALAKHHFPGWFDTSLDRLPHEHVNFSVLTTMSLKVRSWISRQEARSQSSSVPNTPPHAEDDLGATWHATNSESEAATECTLGVGAGPTDRVSVV